MQLAVYQLLRNEWPFVTLGLPGSVAANAFAIAVAAIGGYFLNFNYTWKRLIRRTEARQSEISTP